MSNDTDIRDEIILHMSRAFFGSAWADYEDRYGDGIGPVEILDVMPEIDPSATEAANALAKMLEKQYGATLPEMLEKAKANTHRYADRPCDAEHFGHYAAMQAMGTGVGLESVCDRSIFPRFPFMEFSYYDFDPKFYPIPEDGEDD